MQRSTSKRRRFAEIIKEKFIEAGLEIKEMTTVSDNPFQTIRSLLLGHELKKDRAALMVVSGAVGRTNQK